MATYWENSCSFGLRYVSLYKFLIVSLIFSQLGFWSGNLFLIAPFPDLCLLVPFHTSCGANWRRGRVSDSGPRGPVFDPQPGRRSLWPEKVTIPQLLG